MRRRAGEPMGYFTMKMSNKDYATIASLAATLGISIGEVMRRYIRSLPEPSEEETKRWQRYRKQSGNEKVAMPLEVMDQKAAAAALIETQIASGTHALLSARQEWENIRKEEELKDAIRQYAPPSMTMLEMAELEDAAEKGDLEAKAKLDAEWARRRGKDVKEL